MADAKFLPYTLQSTKYDAAIDGEITRNNISKTIYVASKSDLDLLTDELPGTIAATYGFTGMWQMGDAGEWIAIFTPAESTQEEEG